MKKYFMIFILFVFAFQTNCTTEPELELELIIKNGIYQKVSSPGEEIKYVIEFDYIVFGKICYVGGFSIHWDDQKAGSVNWYRMQKLEPERTYSIIDTFFNFDEELTEDPIINMQGYLEGSSEEDSRLHAQYQLEKK